MILFKCTIVGNDKSEYPFRIPVLNHKSVACPPGILNKQKIFHFSFDEINDVFDSIDGKFYSIYYYFVIKISLPTYIFKNKYFIWIAHLQTV